MDIRDHSAAKISVAPSWHIMCDGTSEKGWLALHFRDLTLSTHIAGALSI